MAMTAQERVRKQRYLRKQKGWCEVKVWVPSEENAQAIRDHAQQLRDEAIKEENGNQTVS